MLKIKTYNQKGENVGEMQLSEKIFGAKINEALVHQAAVTQMANERQVLAHTKTRGEVRGGGKKPWRQKGTGRARAGSSRSPIWIGGGVTFGPTKDRNFSLKINKKMKQGALFMVLSDKLKNNNLVVVDKLEIDGFKTKIFNEILKNIEKIYNKSNKEAVAGKESKKIRAPKRNVLFINSDKDIKTRNSARNLAGLKFINLNNINIVDLLKYKNLIITASAVKKLEEIYI